MWYTVSSNEQRKAMRRSSVQPLYDTLNRIRTARIYVNIFFPFYRDWEENWKPKRLSWKISPGKPSKGTNSSNSKHLWKLHLHETSSKNQIFLLSLSNFNTFVARPMKTKRWWLRKSKKRRLGVCHMQNKLHKVNNIIRQKINKVQTKYRYVDTCQRTV